MKKFYLVTAGETNKLFSLSSTKERAEAIAEKLGKHYERDMIELELDMYEDFTIGTMYVIDIFERIAVECGSNPHENAFRHPEKVVVEGKHVLSPTSLEDAFTYALDNNLIDRIGKYKEFELTEEEYNGLTKSNPITSLMNILLDIEDPRVTLIKEIGAKHGFIAQTIRPIKGKGQRWFEAVVR
jgi:hypothetical protein